MPAVPDSESPEQDTGEQLARDGVRASPANEPRDAGVTRALLSSARHELGSRLQTIQGFSELLAAESFGPLNHEQQSFVEHILEASGELRSAMDACVELAELELVGRASEARRMELQTALREALERTHPDAQVEIRGRADVQPATLDPELFQRAMAALLSALFAREVKQLVAGVEVEGEYARVSLARTVHPPVETLALPELLAGQPAVRNLLWLRLAAALFATQGAPLTVSASLDYAEVRIRLIPAH